MADNLRDELRSIPGVADADIDGDPSSPSGVRIRLHPEADPQAVGGDIQRVLASHGMRSRIAAEAGGVASAVTDAIPPRPMAPPPLPPVEPVADAPTVEPLLVADAPAVAVATTVGAATPTMPALSDSPPAVAAVTEPPPSLSRTDLVSIAVEEFADGAVVVATRADGRRYTHRTTASDEAVTAGVITVVGALSGGPAPHLVGVSTAVADGTEVVTIIVERSDGERRAGAAIVHGGRAYAVGRATWSALHG